jgi:hypothetical protein
LHAGRRSAAEDAAPSLDQGRGRGGRAVDDQSPIAEDCAALEDARPWAAAQQPMGDKPKPLSANLRTLAEYTDWIRGLMVKLPGGHYDLKSFATDKARKNVCVYAVFSGTHTGERGPRPPTGNAVNSDYVYVMDFDGDEIRHMTRIWHAGLAMKDLGWV